MSIEEQDARSTAIKSLSRQLDVVQRIDPEGIARESELGPLSLRDAVPHIERTLELFKGVASFDISCLPSIGMKAIETAASRFATATEQLGKFTLEGANPTVARDALLEKAKATYDDALGPTGQWLAFLATRRLDLSSVQSSFTEAQESFATMTASLEKQRERIDHQIGDLNSLIEGAREAAGASAISKHASIFAGEATKRHDSAWNWLLATLLLSFLTLWGAALFLDIALDDDRSMSLPRSIQVVAARVSLVSIMSFVTIWAARNYRSQKHNETLASHRSHSLQTLRAFVESAGDDTETRNALLHHAATAAFGHRLSGYESPETAPPIPSAPITVRAPSLHQGEY